MAMDFQNQHTTWNNDDLVQIDNDVPAEYRDPINASPAGLMRIMNETATAPADSYQPRASILRCCPGLESLSICGHIACLCFRMPSP
jgi:hypothetical protein